MTIYHKELEKNFVHFILVNMVALLQIHFSCQFPSMIELSQGATVLMTFAICIKVFHILLLKYKIFKFKGYLYLFDEHFKRFKMSIHKAGLELPIDDFELKKIILHTAAASSKLNGKTEVRFIFK